LTGWFDLGKLQLFTILLVAMMVCSLSMIGTGQVEAAGALTKYNIDSLQRNYIVGMPNTLIIAAVDSANLTVANSGTVILTCSDPNAVMPMNPTLPINTNGIGGGVTVHFGTPGTQTVTVTDTTDNTIIGTLTVTVAPIHYSVSVSPATIAVGESVNVTVTALDASDSVITTIGNSGYGGAVDFISTDTQAVYPPVGLPRNLVAGEGVFNITLNTVGSQTITVINRAFPLVNATTNTITVNPAATPTPTVSPTTEVTPTPTPTSQPTATPTVAPTQAAQTATDNTLLVIIVVVVVIAVVGVLFAVVFMRKRKGTSPASTSDLPLPPPPPPT
jgi:hypothetical protein